MDAWFLDPSQKRTSGPKCQLWEYHLKEFRRRHKWLLTGRSARSPTFCHFLCHFPWAWRWIILCFLFFLIYFIIIIFTLQYCIGFAIHQHSRLSSISTNQRFIKNETHWLKIMERKHAKKQNNNNSNPK